MVIQWELMLIQWKSQWECYLHFQGELMLIQWDVVGIQWNITYLDRPGVNKMALVAWFSKATCLLGYGAFGTIVTIVKYLVTIVKYIHLVN